MYIRFTLQSDGPEDQIVPKWVEYVTHVSHLLTTFNSSGNFYIYVAKVKEYYSNTEFIKVGLSILVR